MFIGHINVRSLFCNFQSLKQYLSGHNYDIFGISESWIRRGADDSSVRLSNYSFAHFDRDGRGGGVGIYIRNTLKYEVIAGDCNDFMEHIWIKVFIGKRMLTVGIVYKAPYINYSSFLSVFEDVLTEMFASNDRLICLGDFNINALDLNSKATRDLLSVAEVFNLKQVICDPTHLSHNLSLIDLLFTNMEEVVESGVINANVADHCVIFCKLSVDTQTKSSPKSYISYRNLFNVDIQKFQADLEAIPWDYIFSLPDVDRKVEFLTSNIVHLFNLHAPMRTGKAKSRFSPWLTPNIKLMQKMRDEALDRYKLTRLPGHWSYYKQLRNFTNLSICNEKKAYLAHKLRSCNIREKWKELRNLG